MTGRLIKNPWGSKEILDDYDDEDFVFLIFNLLYYYYFYVGNE